MKKIILLAAFAVAGLTNAYASTGANQEKQVYQQTSAKFAFGTCTLTFTAYNSAGEALYSWTETYETSSYDACLDKGLSRLKELNNSVN